MRNQERITEMKYPEGTRAPRHLEEVAEAKKVKAKSKAKADRYLAFETWFLGLFAEDKKSKNTK